MIAPEISLNESARLDALYSYSILDTLPEKEYEEITYLASLICNTPMSLISLIDKDRQWFKSNRGLETIETSREFAFCAHAINKKNETMIVKDSRIDERFKTNPLVINDPNIVFYAGVPLVNNEGHALGTLCVLDVEPKDLSKEQERALEMLSNQLMKLLDLRKSKSLLHRNNQILRAKNKTLEKFVSVAAHDIKSPMNNILALSDMIIDDFSDTMDPEAIELVDHIRTSTLHSTHLIDGILNYSKESNGITEHTELVHMKSLLSDIKEFLVDKKNVQMIINVDDNLHIQANKTALYQIFSNLVSNSLKYNHQATPQITINVIDKNKFIRVDVIDNGPGIKDGDKKKIFKLFSTTSNKDKTGFHGTGIGLATVKSLVENLGGKISVISEYGHGANFKFTLKKRIN